MLEGALRERNAGRDVVIGYVETHGRKETEALAQSLAQVPRLDLEYQRVRLEEMDLNAVLARKPALALVDELAHTNVPGARHPKRYQDVLELLDAGIDVFTTLNVQHVETRADTVRQITGAAVHETVPDSLLDQAQIELADLTPDELLERLEQGKVYLPDRARLRRRTSFAGEPGGLAGTGAATGSGTREPGCPGTSARAAGCGAVEDRGAFARGAQWQPALGGIGALDTASGRQRASALAGGLR